MQTHNRPSNGTMPLRCTVTVTNNLAGEDIGGEAGSIADRRAARRAAMPITSALLAEFAEWGATVVYAAENGITVGKKPDYSNAFTIPPNYAPCWRPKEKK